MSDINQQLEYLDETKAQIKEAIINKGQSITDVDTFRSYVNKINSISTLETDTADATLTNTDDLLENIIVYSKGKKLVGTLKDYDPESDSLTKTTYKEINIIDDNVIVTGTINETGKVTKYVTDKIPVQKAILAEAIGLTADKIVEGSEILGITGTARTTEDLQTQLDAQDKLIEAQTAQITELKKLIEDRSATITTETLTSINNILGNEV